MTILYQYIIRDNISILLYYMIGNGKEISGKDGPALVGVTAARPAVIPAANLMHLVFLYRSTLPPSMIAWWHLCNDGLIYIVEGH
jgi:hypothetical protein